MRKFQHFLAIQVCSWCVETVLKLSYFLEWCSNISLQVTWLKTSQSGWPSSKKWNCFLFIKETEMFSSVLAQVICVFFFESKASWSGPGPLLVPLVSQCTVPGCLIPESGSWMTMRYHSFQGPAQTASLWSVHPCWLQVKIVNIYSCILYSFSEHAAFFLPNAGQVSVSMKVICGGV